MDMIDGHPIPQDITGFQFRLIGDMTVKQFAYIAVGLILGWLFFILPFPFILKIILGAFPVIISLVFSFVPIQGVPADTMILLFFKALLKPNQYIYEKVGIDFGKNSANQNNNSQPVISNNQKKIAIKNNATTPIAKTNPVNSIPALQTIQQPKPSQDKTIISEGEKSTLLPPLQPPPLPTQPASPSIPQEVKTVVTSVDENPLKKQLEEIMNQKKLLEQQLLTLQQQQTSPPPLPSNVKKVPADSKKTGIAPFMPDVPNLIAGVIKDARGNVLPNILIEVKDKDNNPVRAFKTNALGQFASATPLINGTYSVTFEDPKKQQQFDNIELSVSGEILPPLEITSIDEREELRKSLFIK